jgi:hypothetical protein
MGATQPLRHRRDKKAMQFSARPGPDLKRNAEQGYYSITIILSRRRDQAVIEYRNPHEHSEMPDCRTRISRRRWRLRLFRHAREKLPSPHDRRLLHWITAERIAIFCERLRSHDNHWKETAAFIFW